MRNHVPPHLIERPCNICRLPTKALRRGVIVNNPVCPSCSKDLSEQFNLAIAQRKRQEIAGSKKEAA